MKWMIQIVGAVFDPQMLIEADSPDDALKRAIDEGYIAIRPATEEEIETLSDGEES